eukprot:scaffold86010_cov37-Tisochrysis_lutea.AAC.1
MPEPTTMTSKRGAGLVASTAHFATPASTDSARERSGGRGEQRADIAAHRTATDGPSPPSR